MAEIITNGYGSLYTTITILNYKIIKTSITQSIRTSSISNINKDFILFIKLKNYLNSLST
jgi:hypothetical protein